MNYEFKYSKNKQDKIVAIIYAIVAISLWVVLYFKKLNMTNTQNITVLIITLTLIQLSFTHGSIYLGRRNYLFVKDGVLYKDRGSFFTYKKVLIKDIKKVHIIKTFIVLELTYRRSMNIEIRSLCNKDINPLAKILKYNFNK